MPRILMAVAVALAGTVFADFQASFETYEVGETVSSKGVSGGRWVCPADATASVVASANEKSLALESMATNGLAFALETILPERPVRCDFRTCFDDLSEGVDELQMEGARCGLTLSRARRGGTTFVGFAAGHAFELAAADLPAVCGRWYELRIETCDLGDSSYVSYWVKDGETYKPLVTDIGSCWFRLDGTGAGFSSLEFRGAGSLARLSGGRGDREPESSFHWIGGESGAWEEPSNWSYTAGGPACGCVPGEGELARIDGTVALTRAGEQATVRDGAFRLTAGGGLAAVAGTIRTPLALDVRRPRLGKALTFEAKSFGGLVPSVEGLRFRWFRGGLSRNDEAVLIATTANYTPVLQDCEKWLRVVTETELGTVLDESFFFSERPVLYLTTDDRQTPSQAKEAHTGHLFVQGNAEWKSLYDGAMTIKVRGNGTRTYPKKPWKIKLEEKTKMFGFPKSKHWVLLANYIDVTGMRDKIGADFAARIGSSGMKSTWVECVLNGSWQGLYLFSEQIRVDKNRVDIFDWEEAGEDAADAVAAAEGFSPADKSALETAMSENFAWVDTGKVTFKNRTYLLGDYVPDFASVTNDISGGYLFEFDSTADEVSTYTFTSGNLQVLTKITSPEYLKTNTRMLNASRDLLKGFCDATTSCDGYANGRHYSEVCDIEKMVAYFLVNELLGNWDACQRSRYGSVDRGGKLTFGPVWDFDYDIGNNQGSEVRHNPVAWIVTEGKYAFFKEWLTDPWFCTLLWTRYPAARAEFVKIFRGGVDGRGEIGAYFRELSRSIVANEEKWSYSGKDNPSAGIRRLLAFLNRRLDWLDAQFRDVPTLMASLAGGTRSTPSTNPYVRDTTRLALSFVNAPQGRLHRARPLDVSVAVEDARIASVGLYANGLKVGPPQAIVQGQVRAEVPFTALTAGRGEPNCISLVAFDATGACVARTYALVRVDLASDGFQLFVR